MMKSMQQGGNGIFEHEAYPADRRERTSTMEHRQLFSDVASHMTDTHPRRVEK